jgi:hypothetical protein
MNRPKSVTPVQRETIRPDFSAGRLLFFNRTTIGAVAFENAVLRFAVPMVEDSPTAPNFQRVTPQNNSEVCTFETLHAGARSGL